MTVEAPAVRSAWTSAFLLEEKVLAALALYFLVLRLMLAFTTFPIADEAYYWLWGRHLAISYFDHPPLQAWVQRLSFELFGHSYFALRVPTVVAFAATLVILYKTARRIAGERWRLVFLRSTVVYLATVLFGLFCSIVFIDYLLAVLMMGAGYCFAVFFGETEDKGRGSTALLLGGAVLLGLCGLTKYNAIFLGIAVAGVVLTRPRLWPLLRDWRLYLAAAIAIGMQTPVIIYTLQTNFESFQFHLGTRHHGSIEDISYGQMKVFALFNLVVMSPFIVPAIVSFFWARQRIAFERLGKVLAIWTFWISGVTFLYVANLSWTLWWWNLSAFPLLMPFLGRYIGRGMLVAHVVWGLLLNTLLVTSFTIAPITWAFGIHPGMEVDATIGWDRIVAVVKEAEQREKAEFLSANSYQLASQLAFALNDPEVMAITNRRKAFDDWTDEEAKRGQRGLILWSGGTDSTSDWKMRFQSFRKLADIVAERPGFPSRDYALYLGEGYIPPPPMPLTAPGVSGQ